MICKIRSKNAKLKLLLIGCLFVFFINYFYGIKDILMTEPFKRETFDWPYNFDYQRDRDNLSNLLPLNNIKANCLLRPTLKHGSYRAVFVIKSALVNSENRETLRHTWIDDLHELSDDLGHFFSVGNVDHAVLKADEERRIINESRYHQDIAQFDFIDDYFNNTQKLIDSFLLVEELFRLDAHRKSKFFIFCDDDYYVNVNMLSGFLDHLETTVNMSEPFCTGFVYENSLPFRGYSSKWSINLDEYKWSRWPPYPSAGFFIINQVLLENIIKVTPYIKLIRFDDVYLGILLYRLNVKPVHNDRFAVALPFLYKTIDTQISIHMANDLTEIRELHSRSRKQRN